MTARAFYGGGENFLVDNPAVTLGDYVVQKAGGGFQALIDLVTKCISIDTMNETVLYFDKKGKVEGSSGNPTEVALLQLVQDLGGNYEMIRNKTKGRSDQGKLGEFLAEGKQIGFSSARKMMSWAVPLEEGGCWLVGSIQGFCCRQVLLQR